MISTVQKRARIVRPPQDTILMINMVLKRVRIVKLQLDTILMTNMVPKQGVIKRLPQDTTHTISMVEKRVRTRQTQTVPLRNTINTAKRSEHIKQTPPVKQPIMTVKAAKSEVINKFYQTTLSSADILTFLKVEFKISA